MGSDGVAAALPDAILDLLPKAKRRWARTDPVLHGIVKAHPPAGRPVDVSEPFATLVNSVVHQQVSLAAGKTIYARVVDAAGGAVTPEAILKAGPDRLRGAGLSRSKLAYILDLSERSARGDLDLARLPDLSDDEIVEALTAVKGIGVWTAKMFMIFHMGRPDVLAHEDLGLQIAVAKAYRVPRAKAAKKMQQLQPLWSPYCSVAAMTLWDWRRALMASP